MPIAAVEPCSHIFSRRRRTLADDRPAHLQLPFAALDHHDVDNLVVLLGVAVGVPIEHAEAMIAIVGEGFARRMIGTDVLRQFLIVALEIRRLPDGKTLRIRRRLRGGEERNREREQRDFHGT